MEDDKCSIASSYVDSEDELLTSFQVVPETGIHYQVLVIRSPHPLNVTLKIANGFTEFKELKSHESDSDCNMCQSRDTFRHLGSSVDASRAKAIWDTINGCPKKLSRDTIAPDGASSPASSFAVIDDEQEDSFDLNRLSLAAAERSSIPISETSSFARIKESGDEKYKAEDEEEQEKDEDYEDVIDEHDDASSEEDTEDDKAHKRKLQAIATTMLADSEAIKTKGDAFTPVKRFTSGHDLVKDSNETDKTTATNSSVSEATEPSFHTPHEARSEMLIHLTIEFIVKILAALKRKEKSPLGPAHLSIEYLQYILNSDAFMGLTDEPLNKIFTIERNDPLVEDQLAKSLVKWSQLSLTRANKLPKLLEKVKLHMLEPEQLINLSKMPPIQQSIHCRDVIDLAKNSLLLLMSKPIEPHDYIYILTHDRTQTWENQIHQINLTTQKSNKIATRQAILLASLRHCLFVFARRNITQRAIDVFEFEDHKWYPMSNWPADLVISSMCTYNRCIYFIASIGTSHNFYKYDPSIDEFRMILPPSRLIIKENEKIIPFDKHILFIPSGIAYDIVQFKWHNYVPFSPRVPANILAVHHNLVIYPGIGGSLLFFDPKHGTYGIHSTWHNSNGSNCGLIDLTVIKGKFYLLEKCSDGLNIMLFDGCHWNTLFKTDLKSEPLRCAISTDDF